MLLLGAGAVAGGVLVAFGSAIGDAERVTQYWAGASLSEEGDGWPDQVEFVVDAGAIKDTYVLDYEWDVDEEGTGVVSWGLVKATVLKAMNGSYTLVAKGSSTDVTYRLAVDLNIPMLGMLKRKAEKVIVDTALRELKKRVEG